MQKKPTIFSRAAGAVNGFFRRAWQSIKPGPLALKGAALAVLLVGAIVYLAFAIEISKGPLLYFLPILLALVVIGLLLVLLGQGIAWLIKVLNGIPWGYRWALIAGFVLIAQGFYSLKSEAMVVSAVVLLASASLLGGGLILLLRDRANLSRAQKGSAIFGVVVGGLALVIAITWFGLWRGEEAEPVINAAALSGAPLTQVALPDPSQPGPYEVKTFTYGSYSSIGSDNGSDSNTDRYRLEYGADADLATSTVDGSKFLDGSWKGIAGQIRTLVWGFGPNALPINGQVWYPDGPGPFPLVLMVHGNHNMMDFSDPGYAYLGELLASRGFIFVSVDQNFINGSVIDFPQGFSGENDARGWLLLEHLRVWHRWNDDRTSPFFGIVDTENIAVGGHSRGGEAAAVAAAFNRLPFYPDNSAQVFDYDYNIRAVVAIAPIDGQYHPAKRDTALSNLNYLVIHGSHDSDVTSFSGMNQYARVTFDPDSDWFKAALYIYRANHGQFNTVWGDSDVPGIAAGFLNRESLLPADEQRQVARVYISAFLEAALHGERGYLPLLQDARAAGEGWLPDTVYINRYDQAGDKIVAAFDEDIDLNTTTLPGGLVRGLNLLNWREQLVHSKWGDTQSSAVYLNWQDGANAASFSIRLPENGLEITGSDALILTLADPNQDPASIKPTAEKADTKAPPPARQPVDFTLVLTDSQGEKARLPLSHYGMVQPQLQAQLYKSSLFEKGDSAEPVLQSIAIPLEDFTADNPDFDPGSISTIQLVFDRTRPGSLIIDSVGFRE